jgi:hypothetical protein
MVFNGPNRNDPAERSSRAPKTLGESGRGRHSHSTDPPGAIRQLASQSEMKAYSAIGGKSLIVRYSLFEGRALDSNFGVVSADCRGYRPVAGGAGPRRNGRLL